MEIERRFLLLADLKEAEANQHYCGVYKKKQRTKKGTKQTASNSNHSL